MGNQESKTVKDKEDGETKSKVKKDKEWVNLEKKRSPETTKDQAKVEERQERRDVKKRQRENKANGDNKNETGEIKYVIRRSYIRTEDDTQKDFSNNQSDTEENNADNQDQGEVNERDVKYIIRRSYIRNDDDSSHTPEGEHCVHDNMSDRQEKHRNKDCLKSDNCSKDDPMTDANINRETKSDMNGNLHVSEPEPKHHEAEEKVHVNSNVIQSKEANMATIDLERPRVNGCVDIPDQDNNIPVHHLTSSERNTTTSDTPNTTIDSLFDSKMDTTDNLSDESGESDESVGSDDSVETFQLMTIRKIELNPVVYDNLNERNVSTSLPDMINSDTLTTFQSHPKPDERRIRYYSLPMSGSRNRNTSYDNIRYHSSLETVLEDNGDHGQQELENTQILEGTGNRFEENAELSDYYDNVSLDSLQRSPRMSSPNGSIDVFNETDDNKIQNDLKDKHRQLWLYEYEYEDLSRRIPRTQRPRTWGYYKSTNSLDGYLNRYRPSSFHHRGCMSLSHDVLDRGYNHGGYVNRHGVFVSYDRSPSGVPYGTSDDPGNTSDSSISTLDNEGYFVTPSRKIQTTRHFEETGIDRHHDEHTPSNDSQTPECGQHDPLYSTIEETKQFMPIENLYKEVSGKADEDENNNNGERSAIENVVSTERNDPTEGRNDVPGETMKPGNESEVDVCCGCGSNNKVIAINSTRKVRS